MVANDAYLDVDSVEVGRKILQMVQDAIDHGLGGWLVFMLSHFQPETYHCQFNLPAPPCKQVS